MAEAYLTLMSRLGVSINLTKSVVSTTPSFEFAKVTGLYGKDVSALSIKMFCNQDTWLGRANTLFHIIPKVQPLHLSSYISDFARKSRWSVGSPHFTVAAMIGMLRSRVSFRDLIQLTVSSTFQ